MIIVVGVVLKVVLPEPILAAVILGFIPPNFWSISMRTVLFHAHAVIYIEPLPYVT